MNNELNPNESGFRKIRGIILVSLDSTRSLHPSIFLLWFPFLRRPSVSRSGILISHLFPGILLMYSNYDNRFSSGIQNTFLSSATVALTLSFRKFPCRNSQCIIFGKHQNNTHTCAKWHFVSDKVINGTFVDGRTILKRIFTFILAQQPPVDQDFLIYEISRSHTTTHHSR